MIGLSSTSWQLNESAAFPNDSHPAPTRNHDTGTAALRKSLSYQASTVGEVPTVLFGLRDLAFRSLRPLVNMPFSKLIIEMAAAAICRTFLAGSALNGVTVSMAAVAPHAPFDSDSAPALPAVVGM